MNKTEGFTLIELVVVMAIIAVLAVLIVGAIVVARRTTTETANRSNAKTIETGLEAYYGKYKTFCGINLDADIEGEPPCSSIGGSFSTYEGYLVRANLISANALSRSASSGTSTHGTTSLGGRVTQISPTSFTITINDWQGNLSSETITH